MDIYKLWLFISVLILIMIIYISLYFESVVLEVQHEQILKQCRLIATAK